MSRENKRKGKVGLVPKKIRHRDGHEQTHYVKDGSQAKSSLADRAALRGAPAPKKSKVDVDELRDAVAYDSEYQDHRLVDAHRSGEPYVHETVEVHGGAQPKVILTRNVDIPIGGPDTGNGEDEALVWEAHSLAEETFENGERTIDSERATDISGAMLDTAREEQKLNWESDGFDDLYDRVYEQAARNGIDLSGVTFEEVENLEFTDRRSDLEEVAQERLDELWEEVDEEAEEYPSARQLEQQRQVMRMLGR